MKHSVYIVTLMWLPSTVLGNQFFLFPKGFQFGAATSSGQTESYNPERPHQYARFVNECNQSKDPKNHKIPAKRCCLFETYYKTYIKEAHDIGLTLLRFSIAWEKVNPAPDVFDKEEIQRYKDMCKECKKYGITPLITLYHYTEPIWFWDAGSFEKEKNSDYFIAFCVKMFNALKEYNPLWVTFNTPSGVMGKVYIKGERPVRLDEKPIYKKGSDCIKARDFKLAGLVLKNILNTHVTVYKTLKAIDPSAQIGFLKNIQQHDPYNSWNPLDVLGAKFANWMADDSIISFLRTGQLTWFAPPSTWVRYYNADAPQSFDFIGLNYYTRDFIKNFKPVQKDSDPKTTSSDKVIYPEGMYRALMTIHNDLIKPIQQATGKNIPLYITENGISALSDDDRKLFFEGYLEAIKNAIDDGVNVKGYMIWALMDNWSWGKYDAKYGIFAVDQKTKHPTLKKDIGTTYLLDTIQYNKKQYA